MSEGGGEEGVLEEGEEDGFEFGGRWGGGGGGRGGEVGRVGVGGSGGGFEKDDGYWREDRGVEGVHRSGGGGWHFARLMPLPIEPGTIRSRSGVIRSSSSLPC